jgi:predicted RNA-binding Zn ribbon-like protein
VPTVGRTLSTGNIAVLGSSVSRSRPSTVRTAIAPTSAVIAATAPRSTRAGWTASWTGALPRLAGRAWLPAEASDADAAAARELREPLIDVVRAHNADVDASQLAEAEERLRRMALHHPLTPVITASGVALQPAQPGMFGEVLAAVVELSPSGKWAWVKTCRAHPCRWVFVDQTRNGSVVYCSPGCASEAAMRAYRSRKKAASSGSATP